MKIYLSLAIILSVICSCKKEYTCKCTVKEAGIVSNEFSTKVGKVSKSEAEKSCNELNDSSTTAGQTVVTECLSEKN